MISSQDACGSLAERLADVLPKDVEFDLHHISSSPTRCDAIFSPPPGGKPERTYCETQLLAVSVKAHQNGVKPANILIYAIEIEIYTTAHLTTIFISKADSTGYISLLNLPKGVPSPLRSISSTFVSWLVKNRQRSGRKLVISLFARAQDQYLFAGSIENIRKHVLDDRALVKWWCKVLDSTLAINPLANNVPAHNSDYPEDAPKPPRGYLIVPGFDRHETISFLPSSYKSQPQESKSWQPGQHPLYSIAPEPAAPPRCLVPRFPDDPKSRFLDDLDEELPEISNAQVEASPSKKGSGQWRSVKSLDQFWEMMAFRQECSSGRMVGFIWIVYDAFGEEEDKDGLQDLVDDDMSSIKSTTTAIQPQQPSSIQRRKPQKLTGIIHPRLPRVKSSTSDSKSEKSRYYYWPLRSRGEIVLDTKGYERAHDVLLRLDFANSDVALASTQKWIEEVGAIAMRQGGWNQPVTGKQAVLMSSSLPTRGKPNSTEDPSGGANVKTLDSTAIKKKRKTADVAATLENMMNERRANAIPMSSMRKKSKHS